jgi:hypothetical protein
LSKTLSALFAAAVAAVALNAQAASHAGGAMPDKAKAADAAASKPAKKAAAKKEVKKEEKKDEAKK